MSCGANHNVVYDMQSAIHRNSEALSPYVNVPVKVKTSVLQTPLVVEETRLVARITACASGNACYFL